MNELERRWSTLKRLPWDLFLAELPKFLAWRSAIKCQPTGDCFMCSYYDDPNNWDVWLQNRAIPRST